MDKAIYQSLNDYASRRTSRRQFMRAVSALGMTPLAAESLMGYVQQDRARAAGGALPAEDDFEVVEGTAGALLVAQLHAAGIRYIFYSSGSGNSAILDALVDRPDMQAIVVPFEGQAVAAAQGHAMASEEIGFFVLASDGVENMALNMSNCAYDQVPVIVASPGGEHGCLEPYTAWSYACTNADTIPEMLRRGIKFAVTPPGAPVSMQFPGNLQQRKISAPIYKMDAPVKNRPVFRAPAESVERIARSLIEARSPLFVVGREVTRSGGVAAMQALAEKLSVPVNQSHRRDNLYCDFPTDHPLFMESFLAPVRFPPDVDLLVNFGAMSQRHQLDGVRTVHVSSDAGNLENAIGGQVPVLADVASTVQDLSDALDGLLTRERMERIRRERLETVTGYSQARSQAREAALRGVFDETPITFERLGYELEQGLDRNAVLVPEIGSQDQKVYQHLTFGPNAKGRFGRTTGGQLGWGLGAAFGVQLAMPDRQVATILGDGGMLFGQTEALWTLSRYDAPVLVIILNNHGYNEIRVRNLTAAAGGRQIQTGRELVSYLGDPDVDFAKMAEAYNIRGEKVYDPNDLAPAIQRAVRTMRDGRPYMLDVEVGREGLMAKSTWHSGFSVAGLRQA